MPDPAETSDKSPKAFISYSWTSARHQNQIKEWADRIATEGGVDIVFDLYDLREGQDKYVYMERMVNDDTVTHVLVFSDKLYAEKADGRRGGVGTETVIISPKVYAQADQTKFIPIACDVLEDGEYAMPTFMQGRKAINFSTPEKVNENWETLIRLLHGKPLHQKPKKGPVPAYITNEETRPSVPAVGKFNTLKQVIQQGRSGIGLYRSDFLTTCVDFADALRIRKAPDTSKLAERVMSDLTVLVPVRNLLTDWVMLEASSSPSEVFSDALNKLLEQLLELAARPAEVTQWNDGWFAAMKAFVCETFIYIIAALLKVNAYSELHAVFSTSYLVPQTEIRSDKRFQSFVAFHGQCGIVGQLLKAPNGADYYSPTAELFKRQATRTDIDFKSIMEADVLICMMAILQGDHRWYPQTTVYAGWASSPPLFVRATQHKGFLKLAQITGIQDAAALKAKVQAGVAEYDSRAWLGYGYSPEISLAEMMNLERLDTIP